MLCAAAYLSGTPLGFRAHALDTPDGVSAVHFIDVGQGAAALLCCEGHFALVDTGTQQSREELVSYLQTAGVETLDYVFLSHPHDDHAGGLSAVLDFFEVGTVVLPRETPDGEAPEPLAQEAMERIEREGVPCVRAKEGDSFPLGSGAVTVLSTGVPGSDANDASTVLRFEAPEFSCLFPGDAQEDEILSLIRSFTDVSADVYAVAHHGAESGADLAFLQRVGAQVAVISCGRGNTFGHPNAETLARLDLIGAQTERTDESGSVAVFRDSSGGLCVLREKEAAS